MQNLFDQLRRLPQNTRDLGQVVLWGVAAGLGAVFFQLSVNLFFNATIATFSTHSLVRFAGESFIAIALTSLSAGFLMHRFCRDASGSGVPQIKLAYWQDLGFVPFKAVWVKFIAGVLSIGGGASLGREGPSVFIGGGLASSLGGVMGMDRTKRRAACAAGAAAGLAAAFNTPLAAITFVLEEIVGSINNRYLGGIVLASVCGAFTVFAVVGKQPSFILPDIDWPSYQSYFLVIPTALLAGSIGGLFQRLTLQQRKQPRRLTKLPDWVKPAVGGAATWLLGMLAFAVTHRTGVFGLGYADLSDGLAHGMVWYVAGMLLITKLPATILAYAWGGCGGIFSPLLFLGSMSGFLVGGLCGHIIPLQAADQVVLAVVGMAACFGAAVRAPLTAILMLFEMTHQFTMVPALMLGVILSQLVGRALNRKKFYETVLEQDGHDLTRIIPPRDLQTWHACPVRSVINPRPVCAADLSPASLRALLHDYSYKRFPVVVQGEIRGILTRKSAEAALQNNTVPELIAASSSVRTRPSVKCPILLWDPLSGCCW
jgi:CIC family chloride channel protein